MKMGFAGLIRAKWIFYKEVNSFFGANLPPVSIGLIAFLSGLVSVLLALSPGATYEDITRAIFYFFYMLIIVAAIILSMSSFVNERRQGTMELLYTLPVTDLELVLGKFFLGALVISSLSMAITLVYVVIIAQAPWYLAVSGFLGLLLVGLYAYSAGMLASSFSDNTIISLLISAVILISIDVGGYLSGLFPEPARSIFSHIHSINHFNPFTRGIISLRSSIFFISITFLFLFLTVRVLESRRWRGQRGN